MHNFVVTYMQFWIPISINPNQSATHSVLSLNIFNAQNAKTVSHAGTNYYISNIESNISHIPDPNATQNRFTGTAQFFGSFLIVEGHLRSCGEVWQVSIENNVQTGHTSVSEDELDR